MGIKERREREKLQRRSDILKAAEAIFFEKGYQHATMDDVAAAAELSKGTLYLYFKNKEELYFGLAHKAILNLRDRFQKVLARPGTGMEKIKAIGEAYNTFAREEPEYFKTIAQFEMSQLGSSPQGEEVVNQCHMAGKQVMELVVQAVVTGMHDKSVRQDIDPVVVAFLLQGLSNGVIQLIAREGKHLEKFENIQSDSLMHEFINMMQRALQPD